MQRLPGLDLLRALAIVSVICTHSWLVGGMGYGFGWIERYGWMGVDLFFVLSGYLIGHQLFVRYERSGRLHLKAFYRQRAYRILPAYLVVLALYFALPSLREQPVIQPLWQFLTFTMNLFMSQRVPHAFSSAWSLCVEEYFYLLFPLAILALAPRISAKRVVAVLISLMLLGMVWRGFAWSQFAGPAGGSDAEMDVWRYMQLIYYPTYSRLDGLMCGVALAMLSVYRQPLWQRLQQHANTIALLGIVVVGFAAWIFRDTLTFAACVVGFPVLSIGLALLVAAATSPSGLLGKARVPGVAWIAGASYSIYLTHKATLKIASRYLPEILKSRGIVTFVCCALVAVCVAALLHYIVERPFLRLRDRRKSSVSPHPATENVVAARG
ncbi:acyltransferase family protein [Rhodanobacter sp. BL-MT-08]